MQMRINESAAKVGLPIDAMLMSRLVAEPRGRAFLLGFMAAAEDSDEGAVFDNLLARVDDPELRKLVRIHRDDEHRHARILRERLAEMGFARTEPVPDDLLIIRRIDRILGGFSDDFASGRVGVMETYVLLQVIEERAVKQFPAIEAALRRVDPASADVVGTIVRDEERHVKYARAISKRYATDEAALARTLARYRAAEERAFVEHSAAFLHEIVSRDLLSAGWIERQLWKALSFVSYSAARDSGASSRSATASTSTSFAT
jgi:rubrerythrin